MAATFDRAAPVLPVRVLRKALDHYRRLGFTTDAYDDTTDDDPIYGFLHRGGVDLHLAGVPDLQIDENTSACYLYVDDADGLYAEWKAAAAGGRLTEPRSTPYGLREFAYADPDGNLLRIGSPVRVSGFSAKST
jgi:catechol 2,3-dioxygenase-like lactoylglutathione lyase family enzyme